MTAIYVILSIELAFVLLFAPIPVKVGIRFSLDRNFAVVSTSVFGATVVKIKIENVNGMFRITKNGRKVRYDGKGRVRINLPKVLAFLRLNNIVREVVYLGFIGGENASETSMNLGALSAFVCAIFPDATSSFLYPYFNGERWDFEMNTNARISAFQALRMACL